MGYRNMLVREFAIIRVKRHVMTDWEFPLTHEESSETPLAGPFNAAELERLDRAVGSFPFTQRAHDGRKAWKINAPGKGSVDVWLTSDGNVFLRGRVSLNVVYCLYVHLLGVCPSLAVEDRITNVIHDRHSLLRLVRRDEAKEKSERVPTLRFAYAAVFT